MTEHKFFDVADDRVADASPPAPVAGSPMLDEARLTELRSKRLDLERAREARELARAAAKAIADEERAIADELALVTAESAHGEIDKKIRIVRTSAGTVIVKRPNNLLFRKFQDSGTTDSTDLERLVRPNVVYPDIETFDRMLNDQPAILIDVANGVTFLAGVRTKEHAAK